VLCHEASGSLVPDYADLDGLVLYLNAPPHVLYFFCEYLYPPHSHRVWVPVFKRMTREDAYRAFDSEFRRSTLGPLSV